VKRARGKIRWARRDWDRSPKGKEVLGTDDGAYDFSMQDAVKRS